jgi:hypothetical protein
MDLEGFFKQFELSQQYLRTLKGPFVEIENPVVFCRHRTRSRHMEYFCDSLKLGHRQPIRERL